MFFFLNEMYKIIPMKKHNKYLMYLSIDQSTSSTTVFLFNKKLNLIKKVSKQHKQIYHNKGRVEHNGEEIYKNLLKLIQNVENKISYHKNL